MKILSLMPQTAGYLWYIKLSAPQESEQGRIVADMYYGNQNLLNLVTKRSGYPHNGGEHSLVVGEWKPSDLVAWLDLVIECYSVRMPDCVHTIQAIREKAAQEFDELYKIKV